MTMTAGAFLAILSCGGGDTTAPPPTSPPPPPTATVPARVELQPAEVAVVAGDTIRIRARVFNDRAQPISDAVVTFAISDPAVATIDATGLVTGLKEGHASLTATSGTVSATAPVAVHSPDRETLMDLYISAWGADWTENTGWASDQPVGSWYGVEANEQSRVTALRLSENGLRGELPAHLGNMTFLTELRVDGNEELSGPIPFSLSELGLQTLQYGGTSLCTVRDEGFQAWLNAIPTRGGSFIACNEERSDLMKLFEAMGGENWTRSTNWGTSAALDEWYGIAVDDETGRVTEIDLNRNNLSGTIPPELRFFPELQLLRFDYNRLEGEIPPAIGELTELRRMDIDGNEFKGSIPAFIGNLVKLEELWMGGNQMTGPIPPEMGNLASLRELHLYDARFDGSIPDEFAALSELLLLDISDTRIDGPVPAALGALKKLRVLELAGNRLSGPLPAELGQIDSLRTLVLPNNLIDGPLPAALSQLDRLWLISLENNQLSGPLPPELGDAGALSSLWLQHNPDLAGPLPENITALTDVFELMAEGTGLCVPRTPAFLAWIESVIKYRIRFCGAEGRAEAYLTQAVQSRDYPVPLVAGEPAVLRVFVTSEQETMEPIPPVRATFFVDGAEVHVAEIPVSSSSIPTEVQVGEFDLSANAHIPAEIVQPGLEMVVEVDPDGTVDAALGVSKRIPAEGRAVVDVRTVPPLLLTLIPFVSTQDNDREAVTVVTNAQPNDEYFWQSANLLPVGAFEIIKHASVSVDTNDIIQILRDVGRIRTLEEGIGHWMGLLPNPEGGASGVAYLPFGPDSTLYRGKTSASLLHPETIAHELGHNLSLRHADCGDPAGVDPTFPHDNARTGVWGYDTRDGGSLVPPDRADLMSYCDPTWISDYYFTNALRFRLQDPLEVQGDRVPTRALLVSGGATADGKLDLDPVFVVEAPPAVPRTPGPYVLTGRRADGTELFSLSFAMAGIWDSDGSSGFEFALPVQSGWESELASLTLSGPGDSVEIRQGSTPPMAIMRDPVTGQVRAILRDLPAGAMGPGALDALAPEPGLDIMVSDGLPGAAAWRR